MHLFVGNERPASNADCLQAPNLDFFVNPGAPQARGIAKFSDGKHRFQSVRPHPSISLEARLAPNKIPMSGLAILLERLGQKTAGSFLLTNPYRMCYVQGTKSTKTHGPSSAGAD